jgi:hypothetical protein
MKSDKKNYFENPILIGLRVKTSDQGKRREM